MFPRAFIPSESSNKNDFERAGNFYKGSISEVSRNYTPHRGGWCRDGDIPDDERREHVITLIECR